MWRAAPAQPSQGVDEARFGLRLLLARMEAQVLEKQHVAGPQRGDGSLDLDADTRAYSLNAVAGARYLIRLAERLGVDLIATAHEKIAVNEQRYPVHRTFGDARRAEEYGDD